MTTKFLKIGDYLINPEHIIFIHPNPCGSEVLFSNENSRLFDHAQTQALLLHLAEETEEL
jgi:hypothetical protein